MKLPKRKKRPVFIIIRYIGDACSVHSVHATLEAAELRRHHLEQQFSVQFHKAVDPTVYVLPTFHVIKKKLHGKLQ